MDKIIYQDSCEELLQSVYKNGESMCTLLETEAGVKSAASAMISRDLLEKYRPKDDRHALLHVIAMGNSDVYGFNRNGDYFSGDVLEKRAHTFVTHGSYYEEHRNRGPKYSKGSIKHAAYDPKGMQRVELIIELDKDKDEEGYEMAKKGNALNFSMSCRVPNDRCSCCDNKAKRTSDYCKHLKTGLGQYDKTFRKYAYAINDDPTFFDISKVKVPADRTARHLAYLFKDEDVLAKSASFVKAASAGDILIPSAYAAQEEGVHLDFFDLEEQVIISKVASAEDYIKSKEAADGFFKEARAYNSQAVFPFALMEKFSSEELETCRKARPDTFFREMAKRASILSFPAFCQYIAGDVDAPELTLVKQAAAFCLPDIFNNIMKVVNAVTPMTAEFAAGSKFKADTDPHGGELVQNMMDKMEDKFSIKPEPLKARVTMIITKAAGTGEAELEKCASLYFNKEASETLASAYANYQIQAIKDIKSLCGSEYDNDYLYDIVAGANSVLVYNR